MTNPERQQIAEDELQEQAENANISFAVFAEHLVRLCYFGRAPTSWNDAAEMWFDFTSSSIDIDSEEEITHHVAELIKEMLEE